MINFRTALVNVAALGCVALGSVPASAMPIGMPATPVQASNIENVRWVCNPWGRCWWRPNYYGYYGSSYGYYGGGPRFYGGWRGRGWGWGGGGGWRGRRW